MSRRLGILVALAVVWLAAGAAVHAQKVYIDYDRAVDLTKYQTFAIAPSTGAGDLSQVSPLAHQHLVDGLKRRILEGGKLTENTSDPDLLVTYHVTTEEEMTLNTTGYGYGYGPRWGGAYAWRGGGWASTTTTVDTYTVGTLLFDVYDADTKKAVWRGIASATVPKNPEKGIKKIDSALDKLAGKWKQMQAEGK